MLFPTKQARQEGSDVIALVHCQGWTCQYKRCNPADQYWAAVRCSPPLKKNSMQDKGQEIDDPNVVAG